MSDWNAETAEWYAANFGDYPTNRLAVDYLDLSDRISIVDVGCGTGSALRYASQKIAEGNYIGIDPVPRMIEIAREQTENHSSRKRIKYRVGSAEDLPIDDDFADLVFAFDSIDHWKDVNQGLEEIRRIMKPEGKLILVKDKSVPGSSAALNSLEENLELSGYNLLDRNENNEGEVKFVLWIYS